MSGLKALVVGGSGETGKELINLLVQSNGFSKVLIVGRSLLNFEKEKQTKVEQIVVDFENLVEKKNAFEGYDIGFCCLGTTRAKSGAEGFVRVDRDYVFEAAQLAKLGGCQQFHLLTAQNANKNSWFLYPRTKGEVEEKVSLLGFDRLFIYRPGLLLCDRQERRIGEKILQIVIGKIDFWGKVSVPTRTVAQAMINCTFSTCHQPITIIEHNDIFKFAKTSLNTP